MSTGKTYKYIIDLLLQSQGFSNSANKVQSQLKGVESAAKRTRTVLLEMAGALGFSYGIGQLTQMVAETVKLAAKAEGVKTAFEKLNRPGLLNEMQRATRGTVSDLELMTKAVQARNFKISMEALPTYFQFATNRALETGQAVDYLVESLVIGVGRKSVLWLDNLGLSVTEINEELKKTPDFAEAVGKVIEREMAAAGNVADTTATKIQGITASWENLKLKLGESILGQGGSSGMGMLSDWLDMISASNLSAGQKIRNWIDTLIGGDNTQKWKENKKAAEDYFATLDKANLSRYILTYSKQLDQLDEEGKFLLNLAIIRYKELKSTEEGNKKKKEEVRTLESLNTELNMYNELLLKTPLSDQANIKSHLQNIKRLEEEKKKIMELADARRELVGAPTKASTSQLKAPTLGSRRSPSGLAGAPTMPNALPTKTQMDEINDFLLSGEIQAELFMTAIEELGFAFEEMFAGTEGGMKSVVTAVLEGSKSIINALLAQAIAGMIAGESKKGVLGLVSGAVGIALLTALWKTKVPKFAEGAIVSGPTIAQVGEYPGAKSDPEVISPLSKLKSMLSVNNAVPERMRLVLDGQGSLYGYLQYRQKHLSNYK